MDEGNAQNNWEKLGTAWIIMGHEIFQSGIVKLTVDSAPCWPESDTG